MSPARTTMNPVEVSEVVAKMISGLQPDARFTLLSTLLAQELGALFVDKCQHELSRMMAEMPRLASVTEEVLRGKGTSDGARARAVLNTRKGVS